MPHTLFITSATIKYHINIPYLEPHMRTHAHTHTGRVNKLPLGCYIYVDFLLDIFVLYKKISLNSCVEMKMQH